MNLPALRALLRIARHSLWKAPLRSLLVVALIAIPVAAGTAAAVIRRTTDRPPEHREIERLGSADLAVDVGMFLNTEIARTLEADTPRNGIGGREIDIRDSAIRAIEGNQVGPSPTELAAVVDEALAVPSVWSNHRHAGVRLCFACRTEVYDLDLSDPLTTGIANLRTGRAPIANDEIAISPALADNSGVGIGGLLDVPEVGLLTVVGEVVRPGSRDAQIAVVAPALFDALPLPFATSATLFGAIGPESEWPQLARRLDAATADWAQVTELARRHSVEARGQPIVFRGGIEVFGSGLQGPSRGFGFADIYPNRETPTIDPANRPAQLSTLVAAALALEVALVAAAAFAVGTRRRVVEFGQMATPGAEPIQIRVLVLVEAITLGSLGVVSGVGVALGGVWLARDLLGSATGQFIDHVVFSPIDVLGPALLGLASAIAAAWFPARTVSRVPVTTALAGRVPFRTQSRWVAPLGLAAIGGGLVLVVAFARAQYRAAPSQLEVLVGVFGAVAVLAGAALLSGPLIGFMGRGAGRLGSVARLAVRDSARQRARAGTAVAAMMVTIALPTAAATALVSSDVTNWSDGIDPHYLVLNHTSPSGPVAPEVPARIVDALRETIDIADVSTIRMTPSNYLHPGNGATQAEAVVAGDASTEYLCVAPADSDQCFWRVGVADEAAIRVLGFGSAARSALASGKVVVTLPDGMEFRTGSLRHYLSDTSTGIGIAVANRGSSNITRPLDGLEIVDTVQPGPNRVGVALPFFWVSPETHSATGVPLPPISSTVVVAAKDLSKSDRKAVDSAVWVASGGTSRLAFGPLARSSGAMYAEMHRSGGEMSNSDQALLVVLAASVIAALIAVVVAALSAVELDRDLGVMVAAGAPPSLRRRFLGVQSAYHVGLAAVLGIPVGLLLYWAITNDGNNSGYDANPTFPWVSIGLLGIVLPLAVGLVIAAMFRSGRAIQTRRMT